MKDRYVHDTAEAESNAQQREFDKKEMKHIIEFIDNEIEHIKEAINSSTGMAEFDRGFDLCATLSLLRFKDIKRMLQEHINDTGRD